MRTYAYITVAQDLKRQIVTGTLGAGSLIPATRTLCERYGVSKTTIKRAMDELVHEGLVVRRRGQGTYVLEPPQTTFAKMRSWSVEGQTSGFTAECAERGQVASARVEDFGTALPTPEAARALEILATTPVLRFERTLLADGVPQVAEVSFVPCDLAPDLDAECVRSSFFTYVQQHLGCTIKGARRTIEARRCDLPTATRLSIAPDTPTLLICQTSYLDDGRPLEYSRAFHVPGYAYLVSRYC